MVYKLVFLLLLVISMVGCSLFSNGDGIDSENQEIPFTAHNVTNIIFPPQHGTALVYGMPGVNYNLLAPLSSSKGIYNSWRFDVTGDTAWDTIQSSDSHYTMAWSSGGKYKVSFQCITHDGKTFTGSNNTIHIIDKGTGEFGKNTVMEVRNLFGGMKAIGDLDNDGDIDLIQCGYSPELTPSGFNMVFGDIYLNDGNNTFFPHTSTERMTGGNIELADFNNDGYMDYIISGYENIYFRLGTYVYLNNGKSGSQLGFTKSSTLEGLNGTIIAVADIDRDGDCDVVLNGLPSLNLDDKETITRVYKNNGNGTFKLSAEFENPGMFSVVMGDLDNDNNIDLIVSGFYNLKNTDDSIVYLNDGAGNFSPLSNTGLQNIALAQIQLFDCDGDGDLDLAASARFDENNEQTTRLKVFYNDGKGKFTDSGKLFFPFTATITNGDIDGDGDIDVLAMGYLNDHYTDPYNQEFFSQHEYYSRVLINDGHGVFTESSAGVISCGAGLLQMADFNNDNALDVVVIGREDGNYYKYIYFNNVE